MKRLSAQDDNSTVTTNAVFVAPVLGTPASATLTNATGLPISGLVASTSTALGVGSLNIGHASDTTVSRVSAGRIAVEGVNVPTISSTDNLTNKTLSTGSVIDANVTVTEVLKKVYPVGAIYIATVSTSPATLFGFGTWTAFATGRVMVGKAASGTFGTAGATGGAETHTLTTTEMPSHTHGVGLDPGNRLPAVNTGNAPISRAYGSDNYFTTSTGGDGAHNNLQPYIVTYMWERVS